MLRVKSEGNGRGQYIGPQWNGRGVSHGRKLTVACAGRARL